MPPTVQEFCCATTPKEAPRSAANDRKAPPKEACVLFTALANSQTKMSIRQRKRLVVRIPANVIEAIKSTAKVTEIRTKSCQVAAAPPRPQGPSLSDALSAPVPDSNNIKTGRGTFDTLTGSPLGNK
jgi:hypothetical protein